MKFRSVVSSLVVGLVMLGFASGAYASPIPANATFGFIANGEVTFTPGSDIGSATLITIGNFTGGIFPDYQVNTIPGTFLGNPNDFKCTAVLTPASCFLAGSEVTPITNTYTPTNVNGGFVPFVQANALIFAGTGLAGGSTSLNRYTFSITKIRWSSSGPQELDLAAIGVFHDNDGFFADGSADISAAFTQTSAGGTANVSFTFETPQTILTTPEPATLALFGTGLLGIGAMVRRRKR